MSSPLSEKTYTGSRVEPRSTNIRPRDFTVMGRTTDMLAIISPLEARVPSPLRGTLFFSEPSDEKTLTKSFTLSPSVSE